MRRNRRTTLKPSGRAPRRQRPSCSDRTIQVGGRRRAATPVGRLKVTSAIGPSCTTSIMLAVTSRSPCGLILVIEVGALLREACCASPCLAGDRRLFRGLPLLAEWRKAKSSLHRLVIMDHRRLVAAIY